MDVVVHQPRVPRERHALARGRDERLVHHAVLIVGELVGVGREQIDQHLIEIGFARRLPARHALGIAAISTWRNES